MDFLHTCSVDNTSKPVLWVDKGGGKTVPGDDRSNPGDDFKKALSRHVSELERALIYEYELACHNQRRKLGKQSFIAFQKPSQNQEASPPFSSAMSDRTKQPGSCHVGLLTGFQQEPSPMQPSPMPPPVQDPETSEVEMQKVLEVQKMAEATNTVSQGVAQESQLADTKSVGDAATEPRTKYQPWPEWREQDELQLTTAMTTKVQQRRVKSPRSASGIAAKGCILSPSGSIRVSWDLAGVVFLFYDLITLPLQAFNPPETLFSKAMFMLVLLYWTVDIVLTASTGYFDAGGNLVMSFKASAIRYVKGSFILDILIILNDWVPLMLQAFGSGDSGGLSALRLLRMLRLFRFLRLLRLQKLKRIFQAIEDMIDSDYFQVVLKITIDMCTIMVINHLLACFWFMLGRMDFPKESSWITYHKFEDENWLTQYIISMHWAITQFTPGSMIVQPQNTAERVYAISVLLFALVVFSAFVSNLTQARMELQRITNKLGKEWYILRKFMKQQKIPRVLALRVEKYITRSVLPRLNEVQQKDVVLLKRLSDPLRSALNAEMYTQHLVGHPFLNWLKECCTSALEDLCNDIIISMLAEGDLLFQEGRIAKGMFVLVSGKLQYYINTSSIPEIWEEGHTCCEAVLWTSWVHVGRMGACVQSDLLTLTSVDFRNHITKNHCAWALAKSYAHMFLKKLNAMDTGDEAVSDLHQELAQHAVVEMASMAEEETEGDPTVAWGQ